MEEDKKLISTLSTDNFSQKLTAFAKRNINSLIIIAVAIAYILYGLIRIEETGKSVMEIVGESFLSAVVGFTIKQFRMRTGTNDGLISPLFVAKTNAYGQKKMEISPFIDELPNFCKYKNSTRLKARQSEVLINYGMNYQKFINGDYSNTNDKFTKKVLKKVRNIKMLKYTPLLLTNAYGNTSFEDEALNVSIEKFERTKVISRVILTLACGILFGYFVPSRNFSIASVLWSSLQIAIYLVMGQLEYNNAYYFVTQTLRGKIERVICILDEFTTLRTKHEGMFTVENIEEIKEIRE